MITQEQAVKRTREANLAQMMEIMNKVSNEAQQGRGEVRIEGFRSRSVLRLLRAMEFNVDYNEKRQILNLRWI